MKTAKQTQPDREALRQQALLRLSAAPLEAGLAADEAGEAALRAEAAEKAARDAASDAAGEAARVRHTVEELTPPTPHKEMLAELASREGGALLRIGPRRNRWRELQRYDQELAELEHAREEISRRIGERTAALHQEPDRHAAELADYFGNGSEGDRPESRAPTLEREIADLRAEHKAFDVRHERLLLARVDHVTKARKRMVADVRKEREQTAARYAALVDELEATRQELLELRSSEVWCSIFPSETLTSAPNTMSLVGAKKRLQEPHLPGVQSGLVAASVYTLLRADVAFCSSVATEEQAAAERGVTVRELTGRDARWLGDGKADAVGPDTPATWDGSPEQKTVAERLAAYTEATRRRLTGER